MCVIKDKGSKQDDIENEGWNCHSQKEMGRRHRVKREKRAYKECDSGEVEDG